MSQNEEWTQESITAINEIKQAVLRKKIILSMIIDYYSKYDKIFRYLHMTLAISTPIIAFVDQLVNNSIEQTTTTTTVLSTIVAGMIKLKDYLKFDKTKDLAKQQTIKYGQLYARIDREIRKPNESRQNVEDFIYWINREFANLEIADPDLPNSLKEQYILLCKENDISYSDDLSILATLNKTTHIQQLAPYTNVQQPEQAIIIQQPIQTNHEQIHEQTIPIQPTQIHEQTIPPEPLTTLEHKEISPNVVITVNENAHRPSFNTAKYRSKSVERNRKDYREKMKSLDVNKDLQWAIDRLNKL